jgi:Protein of unknown function, DUF547
MNRREIVFGVAGFAAAGLIRPATARAEGTDAMYAALLKSHASLDGDLVRVDYARWSKSREDRAALDAYVAELATRKPAQMSRAEAFAFWANAYNAITLKVVLDRYPVASIRDIRSQGSLFDLKAYTGPWRQQRISVEGRALSLDDIEHEVMRPTFKDPRVHYTVNCASVGCPNLKRTPWAAATLERDLEAAARAFINSPRGVEVRADGLHVSSIYKWFIADFGGNDEGVFKHLRQYADAPLSQALARPGLKIAGDVYDWTLNATRGTS